MTDSGLQLPAAQGGVVRRKPMLLLEQDTLLRRTVMLTARNLGMTDIHEAASQGVAARMLRERPFHGVLIALDFGDRRYDQVDLTMIDRIRDGGTASAADIPIAVLLGYCDALLLRELHQRQVLRVILKPFRARALLETLSEMQSVRSVPVA